MTGTSKIRTGTVTFVWAMVVLAVAAWFFVMAYAAEVPWMESLSEDGTGSVTVTAGMTILFLSVLLAVRLYLYRTARSAVLLGWSASLPLFAGLYLVAHDMAYCTTCASA